MAARKTGIPLPWPRSAPLRITHPHAAGIDLGGASHFVAVPPDRDDEPVREFRAFTTDLIALADWLRACRVNTVTMESTGVYWIPLYELLSTRGFEVLLVNARHVRCVSGRKSDVLDCQWLQQLHSYGLLRGAFRPGDGVVTLRAFARQRHALLRSQARSVQHQQKALVQMNLQLTSVIADVAGVTGQAIVRAIIAGQRDPWRLAALRNCRIKASEEDIALALQGNWRCEHLFALKQALEAFDFCGQQLAALDAQIEAQLQRLQITDDEPAKGRKRSVVRNAPKFDLRGRLFCMCGVDLTAIPWVDVTTALAVVSETGSDLSAFPTGKHFASWLGLAPGTKISGGKSSAGARCPVPTARRKRSGWRPQRCAPASRRWGRTTGACAHAWTNPRP